MFEEIHLSEEDVNRIHETSMRLLANVGVVFPSEEALGIFRAHGVRVADGRAFLTEAQTWDALEDRPAPVHPARARNPQRDVTVGHGISVSRAGLRGAVPDRPGGRQTRPYAWRITTISFESFTSCRTRT